MPSTDLFLPKSPHPSNSYGWIVTKDTTPPQPIALRGVAPPNAPMPALMSVEIASLLPSQGVAKIRVTYFQKTPSLAPPPVVMLALSL
ncbi:hypothetical protein Vadar_031010 [Vaccinium darrowii]|uniref:Uncharacterized protein n=1 Tax=Vaccinium darrowii TaxID=229202 RepID=A0ACB7Z092_9ERIC|nr:hypothetical protein Vadar_031010 [Vaccinium darrowii]